MNIYFIHYIIIYNKCNSSNSYGSVVIVFNLKLRPKTLRLITFTRNIKCKHCNAGF